MKYVLVFLFVSLASCGKSEAELCSEKLSKLALLERSTRADLFRKRSECQATAIEFNNDQLMVSSCMESYKISEDMARSTLENINKRMEDKDIVLCKYIDPSDVFGIKQDK